MAELYSFFNSIKGDRKYWAKDWANYFKPLFRNGVFSGNLQVVAGGDMSVTVRPGYAWAEGYAYNNTEDLRKDIATASGTLNRYDAVVLQLDLGKRTFLCHVKTGDYGDLNPPKYKPERSSSVWELVLCYIRINAGTVNITPAMITDTRMEKELCGIVTGTVEQIDFTQAMTQFEAFYDEYKAGFSSSYQGFTNKYEAMLDGFEAAFQKWFDSVKEQLSEDAAGNLLNLIYAIREAPEEDIYQILSGTYIQEESDHMASMTASDEEIENILKRLF